MNALYKVNHITFIPIGLVQILSPSAFPLAMKIYHICQACLRYAVN